MTECFSNLKEMKKYYNKKTNTYVFTDIDKVYFNFDVNVKANIEAGDIEAWDIKALNIDAYDIEVWDIEAKNINAKEMHVCDIKSDNLDVKTIYARDIKAKNIKVHWILARDVYAENIEVGMMKARNINYYEVCQVRNDLTCRKLKGRHPNAKQFSIYGEISCRLTSKR